MTLALPGLFRRPQLADPDEDRLAGMLHRILLAGLAALGLAFVTVPLASPRPPLSFALCAAVSGVIVCGLGLLQRGRVRAAATLIATSGFTSVAVGTLLLGGMSSHVPSGFVPIVVLVGLVWGARGLAFTTVVGVLAALGIAILEAEGCLPVVAKVSPLQAWILWANSAGLTALVLGLAVQSQRKALADTRRSQQRYARLVEEAPVGVLVFDDTLTIRTANEKAAQLLGVLHVEGLLGERMRGLEERPHPRLRTAVLACLERGEPSTFEDDVLTAQGTRRPMQLQLAPLHAEGGGIEGVQLLLEDISERRALEAQLHQSRKLEAVGQLAGGVAHDFNNLLTVILGCTEDVLERIRSPGLREELSEVMHASQRAAKLVEQLLAFSRRRVAETTRFDARDLLAEISRMLDRVIGDQVRMVIDIGSEPLPVRADRSQLEQVVVNLAVNARDAMPRGGTLTVSTARGAGSNALIRVRDTGTGIQPQVQERLFEPFFTTKDPGQGTGLGLATAYGIVEQAGGELRVESRPGDGSVFVISLPLADADAEAEAEAVAETVGIAPVA